jgi:nicotinamidase-related amidase
MNTKLLPVPPNFNPETVEEVRRVNYQRIADTAFTWAHEHDLTPSIQDSRRIGLLLVDCQNTFCTPGYELFVGGRSGHAAVDDSRRLCEFIYRNLATISQVVVSLDTHMAMQVFHPAFLVNDKGDHPAPYTMVSVDDVESGRWRVNAALSEVVEGRTQSDLQRYLIHYCRQLKQQGKYELMIWPYHAMLGGVGHAMVPAIEEAIFFHTIARQSQVEFVIKGANPLTENYSVFSAEVTSDENGNSIAQKNTLFLKQVMSFDAVIIAGQAKSHCVAWTVDDLLVEIENRSPSLVKKIYLLEDCMSPVVVPGGADFTEQADKAFERFAKAGMNVIKSTDPIPSWPGMAI